MKKLILPLFFLLSSIGLQAQNETPVEDTIRNMIAIAPLNTNLFGTGNAVYYKRLIRLVNPKEFQKVYYRVGFGLLNRFTAEDGVDRRSFNFNLGLEWYHRLGNFGITYGPEVGYTRASFFNESINLEQGKVFSLPVLSTQRNSSLEKSFYRSYNLAGFVGLRYHIGQHFQFGIESALGWSFYHFEEQLEEPTNRENFEDKGTIRELAIGRHFVLEFNF
jgi:hypothetical protein